MNGSGGHSSTIPTKYGLIWFSGFRGEEFITNGGHQVIERAHMALGQVALKERETKLYKAE